MSIESLCKDLMGEKKNGKKKKIWKELAPLLQAHNGGLIDLDRPYYPLHMVIHCAPKDRMPAVDLLQDAGGVTANGDSGVKVAIVKKSGGQYYKICKFTPFNYYQEQGMRHKNRLWKRVGGSTDIKGDVEYQDSNGKSVSKKEAMNGADPRIYGKRKKKNDDSDDETDEEDEGEESQDENDDDDDDDGDHDGPEKPDMKKPDMKKPDIKKPEIKKPEFKKPEMNCCGSICDKIKNCLTCKCIKKPEISPDAAAAGKGAKGMKMPKKGKKGGKDDDSDDDEKKRIKVKPKDDKKKKDGEDSDDEKKNKK